VDDLVLSRAVANRRSDLFNQRRTRRFHRHAGHYCARRVSDDSGDDAGLSQRRRGKENQDSAEQPPARALYASCEHTDLLELPTPVVRMNCAYYIPLVIASQAFCPNYFRNDLQSFPGARRRTVTPPERQTWSRATARNAVRRPNGSAPAPPAGVRSRGRRPGTTYTPSVDEASAAAARVARRQRTIPR